MFVVNDRVSINGEFATVRFVGTIPPWPDTVALGVEWDNPTKGKNDGSLNGKKYFTTSQGHNGSFIKVNNSTLSPRYTFIASLIHNYGENLHFQEILLGPKYTESYGFEKLNSMTANFPQLTSVSLEKKNIYISGLFQQFQLTNLNHLDISFNLFNDFGEIINILHHCPNLHQLNLNGNRFITVPQTTRTFPVKNLKMSSTFIGINALNSVLAMFPELEELALAGNKYTDDDMAALRIAITPQVSVLDISFNDLTTIPGINVPVLKLLNNAITTLHSDTSFHTLDLRYNSIDDWNEIDKLASLQLLELRINGNPIFDTMSIDEQTIHLIARLKFYGKLNSSKLTGDEITNAELYFISQVQQHKVHYDKKPRWNELLEEYHIQHDENTSTGTRTQLQHKMLTLRLVYGDETWSRTFLLDNSILRVKGIAGRKWQLSVLQFDLYYRIGPIKLYLHDDIAHLDHYAFSHHQEIYIELHTMKPIY